MSRNQSLRAVSNPITASSITDKFVGIIESKSIFYLAVSVSQMLSGVSMPVSAEALEALKALGSDGGDNLVQLVGRSLPSR